MRGAAGNRRPYRDPVFGIAGTGQSPEDGKLRPAEFEIFRVSNPVQNPGSTAPSGLFSDHCMQCGTGVAPVRAFSTLTWQALARRATISIAGYSADSPAPFSDSVPDLHDLRIPREAPPHCSGMDV